MNVLYKLYNNLKIEIRKYKKKDEKSINWAIIGTGPMSNFFCKALILSKNSKIIAISSRSKEKAKQFAEKYKISNYYSNYEEMLLNSEIDIVYIATPVHTHFKIANTCISRNKNVLIEKPICNSGKETEILVRLAREKKVFLMEAMWTKLLPTYREIEKINDKKTLGKLKYIRVDLSKMVKVDPNRVEYSPEYGGVLKDYGIYPLSLVESFMPNIEIKTVDKRNSYIGIDSSWSILLKSNEINAHITISNEFEGSKKAVFYFEKGTVILPAQFNRTNLLEIYDSNNVLIRKKEYKYLFEGFEFQIEEVNRCINDHQLESNIVNHESTISTLNLVDELKNGFTN